jgi:Uma2 family endonuclease
MSTATLPDPAATSVVGDDELYEIIDGKRVRTPPLAALSVWIASELHSHLSSFVRTHNLGRSIIEAIFHLPAPIDRGRRPDVAFVSYQRWAKNRAVPNYDPWDVVPNVATEVVSPNDRVDELEEKLAEYFRAGVELVWVVHPRFSKIEVYQSPTQITVLLRGDALDGGTVIPGFSLPLADLFADALDMPVGTNGAAAE